MQEIISNTRDIDFGPPCTHSSHNSRPCHGPPRREYITRADTASRARSAYTAVATRATTAPHRQPAAKSRDAGGGRKSRFGAGDYGVPTRQARHFSTDREIAEVFAQTRPPTDHYVFIQLKVTNGPILEL